MLNAVEFKTKIKQGIIEIPEEYQQDLTEDSEVQVIVIKQTTTRTNSELKNKEIIDDLTENSVKVSGFLSRDEIYNRQS
ncbi:MAG: hypothetical protein O9324_00155 [Microcystis sp. LE19-84.1B]|jgi:hypothetical protein|uniref:hypothetical protein n=1 Tax=Microcystis sp. LE19-84.1B TaxID=3016438 RepID=UPI001DB51812|nr:hypothetical protein [Microcystis sp. LE19-84.1B]MCZ8222396.1 hypothetical protein [Microcystis sp. LE19-84.1B]NCS28528.1 hypothetical protein [Microcystis aeruginosa F13-15]